MRRMIPNDAFEVDENGDVIFGKNAYVDGKLRLNSAEDLTDPEGNPLIGGGGGGGGVEISAVMPSDPNKIIGHHIEYWDENGGTGRVFIAGNHLDSITPFTITSGKAGAPASTYIINAYAQWEDGGFRVFDSNCLELTDNGILSVSADETAFHHQYVYNK